MDSVDRIEVVKGVASSLYGSQAMGGVINIITKNPVKGERSASVAYGSYGTWIKRLNIGDKVGKFGMRVSYEGRKTNGYENKFVNASVTSKKQKGAVPVSEITGLQKTKNNLGATVYRVGTVGKNNFDEDNIHAKMVYEFTADKSLSFGFTHHKADYGYDYAPENNYLRRHGSIFNGAIDLGNNKYLAKTAARSFFNGGGGETQNIYTLNYDDKSNRFKVNLGLLDTTESWSGELNPLTKTGDYADAPTKRYNFNIQKDFILSKQDEMILGMQYTRDTLHKTYTNLVDGTLEKQSEGKARSLGMYVQDEHNFNKDWSLLASLRYDNWKVYDSWMQLDKTTASTQYYDDKSDSAFNPKLSLQYKINDTTSTYLSWGKAFASPSLQKMFSGSATSSSYTVANPDLDPQRITTLEAGIKKDFNGKATLAFTVFHNDISDLLYTRKTGLGKITYTVNGNTYTNNIQRVENAGSATTNGFEIDLTKQFNDKWSAFANYVYQKSTIDNCSTNKAAEDKQLAYVPEQVLNLGVDYKMNKWNGELTGTYQGKQYGQDDNSDTETGVFTAYDPFFTLNLHVGYEVAKGCQLMVGVNNIFDREYYSYNLCPGRNYYVKLAYKF